jgi:RNA polymerase sigma-70 factor, ECF subfamily
MNEDELILLWNKYKPKIISFIGKDIKSKDVADDILQEVFIKFWENHKTIKEKGKTLQWLLSVSKFSVIDYFREKKRDKTIQYSLIPNVCQMQDTENNNTDESRKLLPIIQSLPVKYRNILLISDIQGIPHKVISKQFDLSISCIKKRIERGRKLLAQKMQECCSFNIDKYGNVVNCSEKAHYLEMIENLKKNI